MTLRLSYPSSHLSLCLVLLVEHVEVREGMRAVIAWLLGEVGHNFRIALVTAAIYRAHQVVERLASNFQIGKGHPFAASRGNPALHAL